MCVFRLAKFGRLLSALYRVHASNSSAEHCRAEIGRLAKATLLYNRAMSKTRATKRKRRPKKKTRRE